MGQLDGKVALVTGGSQGIGLAIAEGLAAEGARIVIADLRGAEAAAAAFPDGVGLTADVADESAVEALVADAVERCGSIDVLVNNAGLYASLEMRAFTEIPLAEWRQVMDVNVASMFLMCRAAVPVMQRERWRPHRQHLVRNAVSRGAVPPPLRHEQGSNRRVHAGAREGGREARCARQLRRARLHDVGRRRGASRGRREAPRRLGLRAHDPARPGAGGRRRRGRLLLRARARRSSPGRRSSSTGDSTSIDRRGGRLEPVAGAPRPDRVGHE